MNILEKGWIGHEWVNEHKTNHNFKSFLNELPIFPLCQHSSDIYNILLNKLFSDICNILFNELSLIDKNIVNMQESNLLKLLLFGASKLSVT